MNSLVSILIPNFNNTNYLRETLESVLNQTYLNWECIVVDDLSTDTSWDILEEYATKDSRFQIYKRPDHLFKGGNSCRNHALHFSIGTFILFLDSDDVLADFCLDQRIKAVKENPTLDFWAFPNALFEKKVSDAQFYWNLDGSKESDLSRFLRMDALWQTSGCLYKRDFLIELNGLSPDRRFWQDYELHLKALLSSQSYRKFFQFPPDVFIRNGDLSSLSRSTPFSSDFNILLERIDFLEEIMTFAKTHNRSLTASEFHSLFSFQYYLILQLWLKHGRLGLFWKKWTIYCKKYRVPFQYRWTGLYEALILKLENRFKVKLLNTVNQKGNFPTSSILNEVQIGKHPLQLKSVLHE